MRSLRVRLTVVAVLVSVTLLSVVAFALYRSVDAAVRDHFDADLRADAELLAGLVEIDPEDGVEAEVDPVIESFANRHDARTWSAVLDEHGGTLAGHDVSAFGPSSGAPVSFTTVEVDGAPARMLRLQFEPHVDPEDAPPGWEPAAPTLEVVLVRQTARVDALMAGLRQAFWLLGVLAALGVAAAIAWQVGRDMRPILRAGERLAAIRVGDLRHRLDPHAVPTEVQPFIDRLNELLARLERGVEREREFTGHVAHELRTPLTVARVGIETAVRRHRDDAVLASRLRTVMATIDDMARLVDDLLLLSRVERGALSERREDIDLHAVVETAWDGVAASAHERGVAFDNDVPPGHVVNGCASSLQTILRNLLANAAAYTEAGGQVRVRVLAGGAFEVWDSGPQLPEAQLKRVFDRFWRADEARTHATTHAGIGLSLVRELAETLRLSVTVENVPTGGLRFLVRPGLPATATSRVERIVDRRGRWKRIAPAAAALVAAVIAMAAAAAFVLRASGDRVERAIDRPTSQWLDAREDEAPLQVAEVEDPAVVDEPPVDDAVEGELDEPDAEEEDPPNDASAPTRSRDAARTRAAASEPPARDEPSAEPAPDPTRAPVPLAPSALPSPKDRSPTEPVGGAIPSGGGGTRGGGGVGSGATPRSGSAPSGAGSSSVEEDEKDCEDGDAHEGRRIDAAVCLAYDELSPMVDNPWFPLPLGRVTVFEGKDEDEVVRIESTVLADTERIGLVDALVVERLEYEDGELVELALDFFAQAPDGTVCYLGEQEEMYEDGELVERGGWLAGEDGAVPGIAMPGDPSTATWHTIGGDAGEEDNANIVAVDAPYSTPAGEWSETVVTREWNPTEPCALSEKRYARGVGMVFDGELPLVTLDDAPPTG